MAKAKAVKQSAAKSTKGTKATKATKAVAEVIEPTEVVEVTPTEATVIDAPADVTATQETEAPSAPAKKVYDEATHTCNVCGVGVETLENGKLNFSRLQNGKLRPMCKTDQTAKSGQWTTERKDYRKAYARANFFVSQGIAAVIPNAKDWTPESVIMTVKRNDEGEIVVDRPAEEVYAELQSARKAERLERKAEKDAAAQKARDEAAAVRAENKRIRDEKRDADAEQAKLDRQAAKDAKAIERAEKAAADKIVADEKKAEKKAERERLALEKADKAKADKEAADAKKKADREAKALDKANAAAEAKAEGIRLANEKALNALKKPVETPATV